MTDNEFKNSIKRIKRSDFKKKSDAELQQTMLDNIQLAQVTTNIPELTRLVAEAELCMELLEERKKEKEWCNAAVEKNKQAQVERERAAILKLKNVFSANAQLIFAMLEEDGDKTLQEIVSWCDEFQAMGEEPLQSLLDELCSFKLIERVAGGKYHLLHAAYQSPYKYPWSSDEEREKAYLYEIAHPSYRGSSYSYEQLLFILFARFNKTFLPDEGELIRWARVLSNAELNMEGAALFQSKLKKFVAEIEQYTKDTGEGWVSSGSWASSSTLSNMCREGTLVKHDHLLYDFPLITEC